jgi:thioesterase domain-containing protein
MTMTDSNQGLSAEREELLRLMLSEDSAEVSPRLVPLQTEGDNPPLFLVGFTHYRRLASHITDRPVYGLLTKELEPTTFEDRVEEMAVDHIHDIQTVQPSGPYYLGGFCFGGLVAYEMARRLKEQNQEVAFLGLFDTRAPDEWIPNTSSRSERFRARLQGLKGNGVPYLMRWIGDRTSFEANRLKESAKRIVGRLYLRRSGSVPMWLRGAVRGPHDVQAAFAYAPGSFSFEGQLVLFQSEEELKPDEKEDWGWNEIIHGEVRRIRVPGRHGEAFTDPHVEELAEVICNEMTNVAESD